MESRAPREFITDRYNACVEVQGLPSLVPDGSVMTGKVVIVSPCDLLVALKAG